MEAVVHSSDLLASICTRIHYIKWLTKGFGNRWLLCGGRMPNLVCLMNQAIFSVVTRLAAQIRSPSFSLLSSSITMMNSPRRKASSASGTVSKLAPLELVVSVLGTGVEYVFSWEVYSLPRVWDETAATTLAIGAIWWEFKVWACGWLIMVRFAWSWPWFRPVSAGYSQQSKQLRRRLNNLLTILSKIRHVTSAASVSERWVYSSNTSTYVVSSSNMNYFNIDFHSQYQIRFYYTFISIYCVIRSRMRNAMPIYSTQLFEELEIG